MSLFLRASAEDDNPAGISFFVGIPRPIGVQDGDLVLIGLSIPAVGVDITPPDAGWTKIARTDPSRDSGVAVYWKFASSEPPHWVFELSDEIAAVGCALVYANVDGLEPIDVSAIATTASSVMHSVAGVSPSLDGEVVALFLAANDAGTFTPAAGWIEQEAKTQAGAATLSAQDRHLAHAPSIASFTETLSLAADGAAATIVLRPSVGQLSVDDVFRRIVRGFPRGVEQIYDLAPGGDYYKYFRAWAQVLKTYGYDVIDLLQLEVIPYLSRYRLADWERVFGLSTTRTTRVGTFPQRQQQVLGAWRAAAGQGSRVEDVQAVIGSLLGYFPTTPVEVIETSRSGLDAEHTYEAADVLVIPDASTGSATLSVVDGGRVSQAGARLILEVVSASGNVDSITLTAPDGTSQTWLDILLDTVDAPLVRLYGDGFAGAKIEGEWTIEIVNNTGDPVEVVWSVLVEGIARNQDTGGAIFHWGAYADPAHLGENGTPADFEAARAAIRKLTFVHCVGCLLQSLEPYPDVTSGEHAAIPNECIPV